MDSNIFYRFQRGGAREDKTFCVYAVIDYTWTILDMRILTFVLEYVRESVLYCL